MYKWTIKAAYVGNLVGALVTNLPPLLFVIFMNSFNLSYEQIGRLVLINFFTQIISDIVHSKLVDKYGVRPFITLGHFLVFIGFIVLALTPYMLPDNPYLYDSRLFFAIWRKKVTNPQPAIFKKWCMLLYYRPQ